MGCPEHPYTSNRRYIKRAVKTALVDKWAPGKWQTLKTAGLHASFATRDPDKAAELMGKMLRMDGKMRVWFTNVYILFDPFAIDKSGDTHVLGVMSERDFLARRLATDLPPLKYKIRRIDRPRSFFDDLCKKYIRVF